MNTYLCELWKIVEYILISLTVKLTKTYIKYDFLLVALIFWTTLPFWIFQTYWQSWYLRKITAECKNKNLEKEELKLRKMKMKISKFLSKIATASKKWSQNEFEGM